jgi:hypothetical protein
MPDRLGAVVKADRFAGDPGARMDLIAFDREPSAERALEEWEAAEAVAAELAQPPPPRITGRDTGNSRVIERFTGRTRTAVEYFPGGSR